MANNHIDEKVYLDNEELIERAWQWMLHNTDLSTKSTFDLHRRYVKAMTDPNIVVWSTHTTVSGGSADVPIIYATVDGVLKEYPYNPQLSSQYRAQCFGTADDYFKRYAVNPSGSITYYMHTQGKPLSTDVKILVLKTGNIYYKNAQ